MKDSLSLGIITKVDWWFASLICTACQLSHISFESSWCRVSWNKKKNPHC